MAEQKNQNEHLNVEDALTQSEAFLIKYKKRNYWRCCCCDYYCSRFYHVQKTSMLNHVKKKHRQLFSKDRNTLNRMLLNKL